AETAPHPAPNPKSRSFIVQLSRKPIYGAVRDGIVRPNQSGSFEPGDQKEFPGSELTPGNIL
ncbi:MAG: hypothetical protein ORN52_06305, partial [Beijerinckiaceae bacterium]|nr:hypothetical protein [Beijerinckiaceae bacterium]